MGIKIQDIAYVRFSAPDLDEMEAFLVDFGMVRAVRTSDTLYMRGLDEDPFLHVTHRGEPGFLAAGFEAASMEDLDTLAREEKVSLDSLDGPGGGSVVRLSDPNGFNIEVVAGRVRVPRIEMAAPARTNDAHETPRLNALKRLPKGPSHVKRLGHCVLNVRNFRETQGWYKSRLGLITSDEINAGSPGQAIGAFLRCNRGNIPSDHHTLFLLGTGTPAFNHAAYEVVDLDDLMCGHDWLKEKGHRHEWGVGRHVLGSQIFDYWRDPWGHTLEHWTDGDLMDAGWGSRSATIQEALRSQWGPAPPRTMGS
ncbi:MAG TPA: VOC family protein [Candidatus Binataceae bacterium]|nr:VOC family protein [Candidatus Binataceae bacterium]